MRTGYCPCDCLLVLPGIRAGLACWSWRLVRAMAAPAITSSRSVTAVRRPARCRLREPARGPAHHQLQRYLGTPVSVGGASQGLRRAPQKPLNSPTRYLVPTGISLLAEGRAGHQRLPGVQGSSSARLPAGRPVPDGGRRHVPGLAPRRVWQPDSLNGITLHQVPQIPGSGDFLPNFLPRNAK
jgi:hypothetical protein